MLEIFRKSQRASAFLAFAGTPVGDGLATSPCMARFPGALWCNSPRLPNSACRFLVGALKVILVCQPFQIHNQNSSRCSVYFSPSWAYSALSGEVGSASDFPTVPLVQLISVSASVFWGIPARGPCLVLAISACVPGLHQIPLYHVENHLKCFILSPATAQNLIPKDEK